MTITFRIGPRFLPVLHHALKLLALLTPGAALLSQLTGRNWMFLAGAWALNVVMLLLLILHCATHSSVEWCPRHKPLNLKNLRHRLAVRLAGLTWVALAVIVVYTIVLPFFNDSDHKATALTLRSTLATLALYWTGLALIAANLFVARNRDALPKPKTSERAMALTERGRQLVHRSHWLVLIAITGSAALVFAPDADVWNSARSIVTFLVIGAMFGDMRHSNRLCETCVTEFRVDAPEYADKRRMLFTIDHRGRRLYWAALLAALVVQHYFGRATAPSIASTIVMSALFAATTLVNRFHRTYQPWCPYCRDNGGGGHEHTEVPDPTGGHGRPVPV